MRFTRLCRIVLGASVLLAPHGWASAATSLVSTIPSWTAESNLTNTYFGSSVRTAGDVNGDGYSDVIVGSATYSNGQTSEGKAFVYLGAAIGLLATPAWSAEGEQAGANFGITVSTAGDVNGDGYDDVIIGAPGRDNGQTDEGQAFVYLGSATGLAATAAWTVESNVASLGFADQVSTAGDVNNDGYADVLVGTICDSNGQPCEGRVRLYLGSSTGLSTTPAWIGEGNQDNAYFGGSLSGAGDVNADGYADVVIGAPGYTHGQAEEGVVFVYHGTATGLEANAAIMLEFNQAFASFGAAVAGAGDTGGDGYADVLVGIPNYSGGQTGEGAAAVFRGSATGVQSFYTWFMESDQAPTPGFNQGTSFGISVATAGDVDGDGRSDFIVGARFWDGPTQDEGAAFLYLHAGAGQATTDVVRFEGNQLNSSFGGCVSTAGDVDGDGRSDVLVSANSFDSGETNEGRVFLYRGAGFLPPTSAQLLGGPNPAGNDNGRSLAVGDVNGDGYTDIIVGAPSHAGSLSYQGKAVIYTGFPTGPSFPIFELTGSQAFERLGKSVACAGDVNGDGNDDVLVGSPTYSGALSEQGKASLFLGAVTMSTTPAWTVLGTNADANLGTNVAPAGDVNGDGYADVLVVSHSPSTAYLYLGSASGLSSTPAWQRGGLSYFGYYDPVATSAGDVNGDGYSDVLVGSPGDSSGGNIHGAAFLFLGSPAGLSSSPTWEVYGADNYSAFGQSVGTAGDLNGDGYSDIIVIGAPYYNDPPSGTGRVYVYLGARTGFGAVHRTLMTDVPGPNFLGVAVGTAGDVDGDGYSDLLIGSPFYSGLAQSAGRAMIYLGSSAGLASAPAWTKIAAGLPDGAFGRATAGGGDVDGDGFADIVIGAPGYAAQMLSGGVYFHFGNGGNGALRLLEQRRPFATSRIGLNGSSDSETTFRLSELGRSAAGRAKIRLQWEVKTWRLRFSGVALGSSPFIDTGAPFSTGSFAQFDQYVGGFGEGTRIRWRARIAGRDPFFPRSPWMSVAGNNITETKFRSAGCMDHDGDGFPAMPDASCTLATIDCDDDASQAWQPPGPTTQLIFDTRWKISWLAPADSGGSIPPHYDTLWADQTPLSFDMCAEYELDSDTTTENLPDPGPGQAFFYVTRARNVCSIRGTLGTTSAGVERVGGVCP